jgi:hypothetical protein
MVARRGPRWAPVTSVASSGPVSGAPGWLPVAGRDRSAGGLGHRPGPLLSSPGGSSIRSRVAGSAIVPPLHVRVRPGRVCQAGGVVARGCTPAADRAGGGGGPCGRAGYGCSGGSSGGFSCRVGARVAEGGVVPVRRVRGRDRRPPCPGRRRCAVGRRSVAGEGLLGRGGGRRVVGWVVVFRPLRGWCQWRVPSGWPVAFQPARSLVVVVVAAQRAAVADVGVPAGVPRDRVVGVGGTARPGRSRGRCRCRAARGWRRAASRAGPGTAGRRPRRGPRSVTISRTSAPASASRRAASVRRGAWRRRRGW